MALSKIVKQKCPVCDKVAVEKSRIEIGNEKLITLECGHMVVEETILSANYDSIISSDGRKLMPYQVEGVMFAEQSNARCLIGDEQGLGKTVQALALLALHRSELFPALITTKTTIKLQWMWEVVRWTGTMKVQVIQSSKEPAVPGMDVYIITYDLLKTADIFKWVTPKTLIIDECQAIKNHLSGRAKAVQELVAQHKIEHIIGLSGTPIKNHAGEYFTILNLLSPTRFPEFNRFIRDYCDAYETQWGYKVGGLSDKELFRDLTKDIVIRRTKDEVLKDLPPLSRLFQHVEFDKKKLGGAYEQAIKELEELMYDEDAEMTAKIAIMTRMRQITGISKVPDCVDFVTDFLLSTDRKITIFVHHHTVRDLLESQLNGWLVSGNYNKCLLIDASMSGDARAETVKKFKEENYRVCIASTLAAGEGLNLQFCSDSIMLERQWNPANEEQAEARFHRFGQVNNVSVTYMLCSGTIDEYFTQLVEQKRAIVSSTLDGKEIAWDSQSLMQELAETLIRKGAKPWSL